MKYTKNYNLKKPDGNDYVSVDDFNENFDAVDKELDELKSDFTELEDAFTQLSADVDSMVLKEDKNVYVSTSGNDETGDGTESKPWRTIQKAVNECPYSSNANIAYSINIASGTYNERVSIWNKKCIINLETNSANVVITDGLYLFNADYVALYGNLTLGTTNTTQLYIVSVLIQCKAYFMYVNLKITLWRHGALRCFCRKRC